MPLSRRGGAVGVAILLALAAVSVFVVPVAATDAGNDAEFRAAWADADETLITLTADITLSCEGSPDRTSDTDIVVDGNGFTITQPCSGDDALHADGEGLVTIQDLTLVGNPESDDGLDTNPGGAVVEASTVTGHGSTGVESDANISVFNSTISDNGDDGVNSDAAVELLNSAVSGNGDTGVWSGDEDVIILTLTTVAGNGANGADAGTDIIADRSTIVGNGFDPIGGKSPARPGTSGGGVQGISGGGGLAADTIDIHNSTVVDNNVFGADANSEVNALFSTISGNLVNLMNPSLDTIHLFASVVIEAGVMNCEGVVVDDGHNFVDDDSCGTVPPNSADPMLGALASNGGSTQTRLPAAGSPLIDAVPADLCVGFSTDQRGIARPQGTACDIGSVEVEAAVAPTPAPTVAPTTGASATPAPTPVASALPDTATPDGGLVAVGPVALALLALLALSVGIGVNVGHRRSRHGA